MAEALTKAIVLAAEEGRLEDVKAALASGASPDSMGPNSSALHVACFQGHYDIVKLLLQKRANPNLVDQQSFYPLHLAASKGRNQICELLLQYGALIDAKTSHGGTALHVAVASDYTAIAKLLVAAGANIEARDSGGNTPLLTACGLARAEAANFLIGENANLQVLSEGEETLLHKLARGIKGIRIKKWNISGEIEGKTREYRIRNGLFEISEGGRDKILSWEDQRICAKLDWGPKAHLAYLDACDLFLELLGKGIPTASIDSGGNTAFSLVCHTGEARLIKRMLKLKVGFDTKNSIDASPLHFAAGSGRSDGLEALLRAIPAKKEKIFVNAVDQYGWTPLHYLADIGGDVSMVTLLISRGADKSLKSTSERGAGMPAEMTASAVARHWKDSEMAALLM